MDTPMVHYSMFSDQVGWRTSVCGRVGSGNGRGEEGQEKGNTIQRLARREGLNLGPSLSSRVRVDADDREPAGGDGVTSQFEIPDR